MSVLSSAPRVHRHASVTHRHAWVLRVTHRRWMHLGGQGERHFMKALSDGQGIFPVSTAKNKKFFVGAFTYRAVLFPREETRSRNCRIALVTSDGCSIGLICPAPGTIT